MHKNPLDPLQAHFAIQAGVREKIFLRNLKTWFYQMIYQGEISSEFGKVGSNFFDVISVSFRASLPKLHEWFSKYLGRES